MIKAILFDLDGTLLPMDEKKFIDIYIQLLGDEAIKIGYNRDIFNKSIWLATESMYKNDGNITNEEVFWKTFQNIHQKNIEEDKLFFNKFYEESFYQTKKGCFPNPYAKDIVKFAKDNFDLVILSTNPLFPRIATVKRMGFVGLEESDFDYITSFENSSFSKPNPNYFQEILDKFNLKSDEVILFGNSINEDALCASKIGIRTILVGDYIINPNNIKHNFTHINMNQVIDKLKEIKGRI